MTINAVTSAILFDILLLEKQDVFSEQSGVEFDFECKDGDLMCFILPFQSYTLMAYFLLLWGGSVLPLRHNIRRVGKLKFWILVSVPLVTFYFMFIYTYDTLYTINEESDVEENIPFMIHVFLIITAGTSCGILYGIGFRSVSRLVSDSSDIKDYMMIAAYGIVIYFVAGNATVAAAGYPPFGLVSVSFVGLSAFLVLQGIYNSAVSVAHDVDLRRSIKKSALKESKLLDSMGKAEIQHELEKKVMKITKDKAGVITQESEVQPSLSEDELKKYFDEVISEVRKEREK